MGKTDGDPQPSGEPRPSPGPDERPSPGPGQDALQVPTTKRRRIKSPTPGSIRGRSMTPIRGRSQTPFSLYLTRRSATPSTWRSITPFLKREDKEKTPFELGRDIKQQLFCNKAVFDKALIMDITEPEVEPVRYITTDMSVIDRAAVMDVSNVEVIYVVEEYEEYEEYTEEEREASVPVEEKKKKKKKKGKKSEEREVGEGGEAGEREKTPKRERTPKREKTPKREVKKKVVEKKDKREKSPSPKLSLKLEMGGGPKVSKKMFEQKAATPPPPPEKKKPPPKKVKTKLQEQMEEQAKAAAKAAEEAAKKKDEKPKRETYEERQKRLKAEAEEKKRQEEEERRRREEEEAARRAEEEEEESGEEEDREGEESGEGTEEEDEERSDVESGDESVARRTDAEQSEAVTPSVQDEPKPDEERRGSGASENDFVRPDPEEEEKWRKIAEEEGEEFMQKMRKYSKAASKSEKERDADWQKHREASRRPAFINFLTDRAVEVGNSVRLACAVAGPDLSAKWFKDSRQIGPGPRHRINNNNNILSLEILNATIADCGEYSCVIANSNDEVTSSCIVTIYEVFKDEPSPPTISVIRDFYHLHDDELTIECHIHGIPRPKVTWLKDSLEIKPSFKYTILEEAHGVYKLMIYRPSAKDSGKYVCQAVNDSGQEEITHTVEFAKPKTTHIHFLQKEKGEQARRAMEEAMKSKEESEKKKAPGERRIRQVEEPPVPPKNKLKFATHLRDRIALEGATVKLVCQVIGPDPAVRWLKDDKPLPLGPKVKNLSQENKAVVELVSVTAESSGVYKCIAKNPFSEIDTQCYLKVYSAKVEGDQQEPMFVLPMRDVYHSSENDLIIDTKVRGNPRPNITWLRDDLPITLDARVQQIEHLDGVCELIINKPKLQDSGNYICVAENSLGSQRITHKVVVENIPVSRRSSGSQSGMVEEKEEPQQAAKKPSAEEGKEQKGKPPSKKKQAGEGGEGGGRRRQAIPEPSPKEKIYFIAHMTNRYLPEGQNVKLQAVIGGPDPQVKWLKNGGIVPYGPRIRNLSRESLAILEITKATVDDSGEYTIVARNPANEITTSALLHVYQPKVSADLEPMFTRALKDTYHLNTNELILETHVRGQPKPTVTWYKDSVEIEKGEKYQVIEHPDGTCELIIDKPVNADSGKYLCKAENQAGTAEVSHYVLFEGKAAKIAENIHGVFHADKSLLKSKEQKETEEQPAGEKKEDEKKPEEKKEEEGKAKGKKPKPKGAKSEPEPKDTKPAKEEKREKRVGIYFGAKLTDRVVAEGSKVKLTCYVEGKDPQIRWLKDDQPIVYSPKVRQNYREGLCTLELLSAKEADTGKYKCYAKDETGEAFTICNINVYASPGSADVPPTFTRAIKDTYNAKVNELVLNCHIRGLPTPTVSWVKDGVRIEPSEKYQILEHADGTCELVINDPIPYDSGKYVCQAENRVDKAEIVHMVHVEAKNLRPSSPAREVAKEPEPEKQEKKEETKEEGKEEKKDEKKDEKKKEKGKKSAGESRGRRSAPPPPDPKKKLYFANSLVNRVVPEGSNIRMSAYINGPDPQVRWLKNDQPVVYGPKSKQAYQDGLAILVLSKLSESDSGEYKLIARNPESEITTSCNLIVYKEKKDDAVPPVFTVGIKGRSYFLWFVCVT